MPYIMDKHLDYSSMTDCSGSELEVDEDEICHACGIPEQALSKCEVCRDTHKAHWEPDDLRVVSSQE